MVSTMEIEATPLLKQSDTKARLRSIRIAQISGMIMFTGMSIMISGTYPYLEEVRKNAVSSADYYTSLKYVAVSFNARRCSPNVKWMDFLHVPTGSNHSISNFWLYLSKKWFTPKHNPAKFFDFLTWKCTLCNIICV